MASVPSIGCLLAKNQYYRKSSISSVSSLTSSDSVNLIDDDRPLQALTVDSDNQDLFLLWCYRREPLRSACQLFQRILPYCKKTKPT
ncbi:pancreatic progenitor cell differentiation and proliferation factor-like protein isoform X1 [Marmota flaviventris]|uniref:pancreatic progenitor cell differentiation and proliferation factor-like protein isoform X1 n=1 Tax=Marmota flaviventris TaxID=93162 RepID=UPI003A88FAF5